MMPLQVLLSITKRRWLFGIVVLLVVAILGFAFYIISPPRPNIVIVTFDTTRADRMGAYGYGDGLTEAFDNLGRQGVVFDHAYAPAPLTLPSHTTILTGLYPPEHGLRVNGAGRLADEVPLLSEVLQKNGYKTGAFVASFVLDSKFGLDRGFDTYDDDLTETKPAAHAAERRRDGQAVVDSCLAWLRSCVDRPFFCWIHLYDAHDPYDSRPALFGQKFEKEPYDAGVAYEVQQLDRILEFLRNEGLNDRTIVVVAGDHGEGLGDHSENEHGMFVYNSTLHVPLVIAGPPELCKPGCRVSTPVSLVDLMPTLLDVLRIPNPDHVSGRSLQPAMRGDSLPVRACYAETEAPFRENRWCPQHAVIVNDWKYIHTTRPELFNLESDPREEVNLVDTSADQLREMQSILEVTQEAFVVSNAGNLNLTASDLQKLRDLGYLAGGNSDQPETLGNERLPDMKDMWPFLGQLHEARQLMRERRFEEAGVRAQEIVNATDQYPMARVVLGDALVEQGRFDEAAASYQVVLEKYPENAIAHAHMARLLVKQERLNEAVAEFRKVISLDSEAPQTHFDLAETLVRLEKPEEAITEFREAIRSDPGFVIAHFQLGLLLYEMLRFVEAADSMEQAVAFAPDFAIAHVNLAAIYQQLNQSQSALEHARKGAALLPNSFDARFQLGVILMTQKRFEEALNELEASQLFCPDAPQVAELIQHTRDAIEKRKE